MLEPSALRTTRLILRPLRVGDAAALFPAFRDPRTMRYFGEPHHSLADTEALFDHVIHGAGAEASLQWAICRDGGVIGSLSLNTIANRTARMGFILLNEFHGRGFATEAAGAVLDFAFGSLGLHRVALHVDPENRSSRRVASRLGFTLAREWRARSHAA
jgi:ribosomal-protein-alanine N-acetyltransferase